MKRVKKNLVRLSKSERSILIRVAFDRVTYFGPFRVRRFGLR